MNHIDPLVPRLPLGTGNSLPGEMPYRFHQSPKGNRNDPPLKKMENEMKKIIIALFMVSTLFPGFANATYHLNSFFVQHRVYENGKQMNRLGFEVVNSSNQYPTADVLSSVVLTDPNGKIVNMTTPLKFTANYWLSYNYYDANSEKWVYQTPYLGSDYSTELLGQLIAGTYRLTFTDKNGEISKKDYVLNQLVTLPIIPSSSYRYYHDQDGNFICQWQVPENIDPAIRTYIKAYIDVYDEQETYLGEFSLSKIPTDMGWLFVPRQILDQAWAKGGTSLKFGTRIRTNDNNNLACSTEITLFQNHPPTECTAALDGNLLLHIPYLSFFNSTSGPASIWADLVYEFNPTYPASLFFKLKNYDVLNNPSFSCAASTSTLSNNLKIHVPDVLLPDGTLHLWLDLEFNAALSTHEKYYWAVSDYGIVSN